MIIINLKLKLSTVFDEIHNVQELLVFVLLSFLSIIQGTYHHQYHEAFITSWTLYNVIEHKRSMGLCIRVC